jgi:hypothetical protein
MAERRRGFWQENALTLVFVGLFVAALVGQAVAGWYDVNEQQQTHGESLYSFWHYVFSSEFGVDVMENWQSEFLQFASFIALSTWFRQRGSTESKSMDQPDIPTDKESKVRSGADADSPSWAGAGGWRTAVYGNSLLGLMVLLWLGSWGVQSITGWRAYNSEQTDHKEPTVGWSSYLGGAEFWDRSLQNWQSEFLAVASISVFSVYLRQRGSAQSKPVGAPHHDETGDEPG